MPERCTAADAPAEYGCNSAQETGVFPQTEQVMASLQQCRVNISVRHTGPPVGCQTESM